MQLPATTRNYDGNERRVGIEIEFAGLDAAAAAAAVIAVFGGSAVERNRFLTDVIDTDIGEFRVELDAELLQNERYREMLSSVGLEPSEDTLGDVLEDVIAKVAATVVPLEICSPPIPMSALDKVERLVTELRHAGALGTARSPLYAFGMQFNPEVVSLEPAYILRVLQSFIVQFDDICAADGIDLTRRLLPYVRPFSDEFCAHFCDQDYAPAMDELIGDYLRLNPSRNRPLDLLPLFAFIDEDGVLARAAEPELIKPRPTFHYRLPDCHIDQADWSLESAWRGWLGIEQLADEPAALRERLEQFG